MTVPGYGGLRVELPTPEPTEEEVDGCAQRAAAPPRLAGRRRAPVGRGDYVTLDLVTTRDGEEVPALNTEDWSYEVGQGWIADEFDEQLIGADGRRHADVHGHAEGHRGAGRLPGLGDQGAGARAARADRRVGRREPRPSSTRVDAWRAATRERLQAMKLNEVRQQLDRPGHRRR